MAQVHVGTDRNFIGLISRHVFTVRLLQITDGSYLAITGQCAFPELISVESRIGDFVTTDMVEQDGILQAPN